MKMIRCNQYVLLFQRIKFQLCFYLKLLNYINCSQITPCQDHVGYVEKTFFKTMDPFSSTRMEQTIFYHLILCFKACLNVFKLLNCSFNDLPVLVFQPLHIDMWLVINSLNVWCVTIPCAMVISFISEQPFDIGGGGLSGLG